MSPETIGRALFAHPEVRESLVFGAANAGVDGESLKQFLLAQLPAWQVPREWRFVESLSPNQRGKLSRAEWRTKLGFAAPG